MPSPIKILSWNIEHFRTVTTDKAPTVAAVIRSLSPDVFGLYEIEAAPVYDFMVTHFPDYSLFITEGQQTQEVLVACRNVFQGIKFEQRHEFRSGSPNLRPGAFLTFKQGADFFGFLFLHTDSGSGAVDFGNRNEMFEHTFNLKRKLDKVTGGPTNFMLLGDLNTMGLKYPSDRKSDEIADTARELAFIDRESQVKRNGAKAQMRRLTKPAGTHFSTTYGISDLDHILAADHLQFVAQPDPVTGAPFEVKLGGWRDFPSKPQREAYTATITDHCYLYCELQAP